MKCSNCNGEWTPPQNMTIENCPFCGSDLSKIIFNQLGNKNNDSVLTEIIDFYGTDILKDQGKLEIIITTNFSNDLKYKNLLLVSVRESIQLRLASILNLDFNDQVEAIDSIATDLENNAFLNKKSINQIIDIWKLALRFSKEQISYDLEIVWENGFCGIRNLNSKLITEIKYDYAILFKDGYAALKLNGKWGHINSSGRKITEIKYDSHVYNEQINNMSLFYNELARVVYNGKWGYIDKSGKEVVSLKYNYACNFDEFAGVLLNGKWGYLNLKGTEITPFKYDTTGDMYGNMIDARVQDGLSLVRNKNKYGYIDNSGKEIIPIIYDNARSFNNGTAEVQLNKKWDLINKAGNIVTTKINKGLPDSNHKYDYIFTLNDGLFCVSAISMPEKKNQFGISERKYGIIDNENNIIIPIKFDRISKCFKVDLVEILLNKKHGLIDLYTTEITPIKYDLIWSFSEGFARVTINKKSGYINLKGIEITKIRYDESMDFINGLARVMINNKWGYINIEGEEVIPLKYDKLNEFKEGLSVVKLKEKYGYIDKNGIVAIPLEFDYALDFEGGLSSVKKEDLWALIDKHGTILTPFKYDSIWEISEDILRVRLDNKYGFINRKGNEITSNVFSEAEQFRKGYARVKYNGDYDWSFIDKSGDVVIVSEEILKWYERFDEHRQ